MIARNVATGSVVWSGYAGPEPIEGANLIVRSNVVVASAVFTTVGFDAQTGQRLWTYSAPKDTVGVSPALAAPGNVIDSRIDADNDAVYIPAWGASVSAVDLRTGAVRWIWQPGVVSGDTAASGVFRSGSTGLRVSGDTVFATMWHDTNRTGGSSDAWVIAIKKLTGEELWRIKLPLPGSGAFIQSAPAFYHNLVIVHTAAGAETFAIDRTTREIVWEAVSPSAFLTTSAGPEVVGDVVYEDGGDAEMYALRASDGGIIWKSPFGASTLSDMLVTPRNVIFTDGAFLHIVDRQTGAEVTSVQQPHTSDPLISSPAQFANGLVFVTVGDAAWCFDDP